MKKKNVEEHARSILRDHGLIDTVVDPVRLANDLHVKVYNAKFGDEAISGLLAKRGGKISIFVNVNDSEPRKRFTIAHELGHLMLHVLSEGDEIVDNADNFRTPIDPDAAWTNERRQEWEANVFAAELLMPKELIVEAWKRLGDIDEMSDFFRVSKQALAIRLDDLKISA